MATSTERVTLRGRRPFDRFADIALKTLTILAAIVTVIAIVEIAYQIIDGAHPAV